MVDAAEAAPAGSTRETPPKSATRRRNENAGILVFPVGERVRCHRHDEWRLPVAWLQDVRMHGLPQAETQRHPDPLRNIVWQLRETFREQKPLQPVRQAGERADCCPPGQSARASSVALPVYVDATTSSIVDSNLVFHPRKLIAVALIGPAGHAHPCRFVREPPSCRLYHVTAFPVKRDVGFRRHKHVRPCLKVRHVGLQEQGSCADCLEVPQAKLAPTERAQSDPRAAHLRVELPLRSGADQEVRVPRDLLQYQDALIHDTGRSVESHSRMNGIYTAVFRHRVSWALCAVVKLTSRSEPEGHCSRRASALAKLASWIVSDTDIPGKPELGELFRARFCRPLPMARVGNPVFRVKVVRV